MFSSTLRKRLAARLAGGACAAVMSAVVAPALAQTDWKPQLIAPANGVYGPSDPIRLRLPKLPVSVLQSLSLELDDFDVTELVTPQGDVFVLTPPQALAYGEHQLRLVENAPDGSIIERGAWTLPVRKSASFREASFQAATTINGLYRIADDNLPTPEPKKEQWNGAAQLQGAVADGAWRLTGQADLLGNAQRALMPRGIGGGHVDLGAFLVGYDHGPIVARAGHHSVGPESLIMAGFLRRGVSLGVQSAEIGATATAFSLRTADVIGFEQGFGVGDSDNRTDGVTLSFQPLTNKRDALLLSATYLKGEGPAQSGAVGTGIAGESSVVNGSAASLVADGVLLDKRLRLRGEYATSRFDFDGQGADTDFDGTIDDLPAERDDAYSALVTYLPFQDKIVGGRPLTWNVGIENRRLGTFFRSPANPIGLADRQLVRGFTGVNWSSFDLQLSSGREHDNVDNLPLIARTEARQNVYALTYTPPSGAPAADGALPPLPWYGQPVFNVTYIDVDQDVDRAGSGLSEGALNAVSTLSLTASFTYPTWSWMLGRTHGKSENFINETPDTKTRATQLSGNFRFGERLTFAPTLQLTDTDETDLPAPGTPRRLETLTAGVSIGYLFSDRLNGTLGYNLNRSDASDGSQDVRTSDVIANLAWTVVPPREARPGFTLALDGQYQDLDDRVSFASQSQYQVYLRAAVSWLPTW